MTDLLFLGFQLQSFSRSIASDTSSPITSKASATIALAGLANCAGRPLDLNSFHGDNGFVRSADVLNG